jgi:hypothetical protein
MISDQNFLTVSNTLTIIKEALDEKKPLSLVRLGDGENLILAQDTVMSMEELLKKSWVMAANEGKKGVTIPNLKLRDEMVKAIKKADIVGIPFWKNDPILADQEIKRPLTEAVFKHYNLSPERICHTFVNRVFAQKKEFWELLRGKKILIIGDWGQKVERILKKKPYSLNISFTLPFSDYKQMEETLENAIKRKKDFDIALIACGVNAVVLSPLLAQETGKVCIDFGKSLMFIVQKKAGLKYSSRQANKHMLS